jgi:hypothetical protein
MAAKLTRLNHKIAISAPSGRELYHLQFSLQAASPETFGYTLVCKSYIFITVPYSLISYLFIYFVDFKELSVVVLGYGLDDRGLDSRQGLGIFVFTTASIQALGPTQTLIQ